MIEKSAHTMSLTLEGKPCVGPGPDSERHTGASLNQWVNIYNIRILYESTIPGPGTGAAAAAAARPGKVKEEGGGIEEEEACGIAEEEGSDGSHSF